MSLSLFARGLMLALVLTVIPSPAQTNAPAATKPPPSAIDNDDMKRLNDARNQVLAQNPDLAAEEKKLKDAHDAAKTNPPTPEQKQTMMAEWQAYQKKMRAAILKIDPSLAKVFAELDKNHPRKMKAPSSPASTPTTNAPAATTAPAPAGQ